MLCCRVLLYNHEPIFRCLSVAIRPFGCLVPPAVMVYVPSDVLVPLWNLLFLSFRCCVVGLPQVRPDSMVPSPRASVLLEHLRHGGGHVERGLHLRGAAGEEAVFPGEEPDAPAAGVIPAKFSQPQLPVLHSSCAASGSVARYLVRGIVFSCLFLLSRGIYTHSRRYLVRVHV